MVGSGGEMNTKGTLEGTQSLENLNAFTNSSFSSEDAKRFYNDKFQGFENQKELLTPTLGLLIKISKTN